MYKSVELIVGDKLLRGCVRTPEGSGKFPTVCFYHGFTVDKVGLMRLHELFARECIKNGIACVRFDFYGCGESDGDFNEMTVSAEIEQAEAIYRWTCEQDFADSQNVYPCGHSLGGAITSVIAPKLQPKGAILWSPGLNVYYGASHRARTMQGPTENGYDINGLELSHKFLEDVRKLDLLEMAKGYDKGVLVIHGSNDDDVPVAVVYQYGDIYGDTMEFDIIEGANHQFSALRWKKEVYDRSIAFLKKKIAE
ncbi:alpha/beta fold hydrolase [Petroclostridium sp. X23]|uniref:alpha/beta hydrolase family protein n=1 Tax=Petroclostridium sp. X23 TaxID=3045146 RepID=UPI0024AE23D5|nr:alpha/beta fold hydrolase [Petroclostridium sp. X23]WHH56811.1 alpha/beta hydrolase [Petroclostridium sp. X23]